MSRFDHYYTKFAAAFVRGRQLQGLAVDLPQNLLQAELQRLDEADLETIFQKGEEAGLRLHKFKRTMALPRVQRVLGVLRSLAPSRLLDVGTGRGVFLWPLLDTFPDLEVCAVDHDAVRARDLQAVHLGGIGRLTGGHMDAMQLEFDDHSFELVTLLEVLEHIPKAQAALDEAVRAAARLVVVSVPSKEDDNPEHLHLFSQKTLATMLAQAGAKRVTFDYVLGHMIAIARVSDP